VTALRARLGASCAALLASFGCATTATDTPLGAGDDGGAPEAQAQGPDAPSTSNVAADAAGADGPATFAPETGASTAGREAAPAGGCGAAAFCDDFESDTAGMAPGAARWTVSMGCNPNNQDGPADGGGLLVGIDDSQAHSGARSLRVVGGDSCGFYAVHTRTFAGGSIGPQLFVRFYARFSGSPTQNHNGFLSIANGSDHLRLGFQDQVVAWNAQTTDATLPDMDPQGTTLSAATTPGRWSCFEFHVDGTNGHIEFWLDGATVTGLTYVGSSQQGVNDQWARSGPTSLSPTSLGLGWLGLNDQMTTWFDDVAVGGSRIGCN